MKIEQIEIYPLSSNIIGTVRLVSAMDRRTDDNRGEDYRWMTGRTVGVKVATHGRWSFSPHSLSAKTLNAQRQFGRCYTCLDIKVTVLQDPQMLAISAFDMALWDIAGKAAGLPVCELLGGGVRDRIPVYATGLYYTEDDFPAALTEEALGYAQAGFTGMKMKIGGKPVDEISNGCTIFVRHSVRKHISW